MIRTIMMTGAVLLASLAPATAAEPIVGNWKTASGETAVIAQCGSAYCVTLKPASMRASRSAA